MRSIASGLGLVGALLFAGHSPATSFAVKEGHAPHTAGREAASARGPCALDGYANAEQTTGPMQRCWRLAFGDGRGGATAGGTPLGAGGGEPGRLFQSNLEATRKGDVDALLGTVIKMQADIMREQRNSPAFTRLVELNKASALTNAIVRDGRDYGDKATLNFTAKNPDGSAVNGKVDLVKESDGWKVKQVSFRN